MSSKFNRRDFLKMGAASVGAASLLAACAPAAPAITQAPAAPAVTEGAAPAAGAALPEELYGMVVFLKGSEFFNWCYKGMKDAAASVLIS